LDLVLQSSLPDLGEIKEIVADIRHDQNRASEVIRRLRSLLEKAPFEVRDIDLNEVVRETEKFLSAFSAFSVDLSTSITPEPLPTRGDRIQLQQVILNLIVNAVDAMSEIPRAERKVTIRTTRIRDLAEVSISDAGPGIPPDKLKEVFEPFFTTKARGMGLSIVRTIVEAHIGQIVAENQAGGGAVLRVTLPLAKMRGKRDRRAGRGGMTHCPASIVAILLTSSPAIVTAQVNAARYSTDQRAQCRYKPTKQVPMPERHETGRACFVRT
jgi:signal transduction histidine kinase